MAKEKLALKSTLTYRLKGTKKLVVVKNVEATPKLCAQLAKECDYYAFEGSKKSVQKKPKGTINTAWLGLPLKWLDPNTNRRY